MDPILSPSELDELRAEELSMMLDTFAAYAPERTTVDGLDVDGFLPQEPTQGKVSGRSPGGDTVTRTVTIGGVERPVVEGGLHIPLDAEVPKFGWEYELIKLGPMSDPALLNRRWRVVDVPAKSYATARRLDVVEVPS